MKISPRLFILFLIILSGIVVAQAQSGGRITEITLTRTACFGACPEYEVILRADGTATYVGRRFVKQIGTYKGRISKRDFNKLARLLMARNFFGFNDHYGVTATDLPSAITSAVRGGTRKKVDDYGPGFGEDSEVGTMPTGSARAPAALHEIEKAIDAVVKRIKWAKVSDNTEPPSAGDD